MFYDLNKRFTNELIISHTTSVGMTLILVSFFLISHTTLVGMTLILVSFFISHTTSVGMTLIFLFLILIIILATKASSI